MIKRIDVSNFDRYAEETIGSSSKVWLDSMRGGLYLFKAAKFRENDNTPVYNDVAECISSQIGILAGLNCAEYYLSEYNGVLGNITPNFTKNTYGANSEEVIPGIQLIYQVDSGFKNTWLENPKTKDLYTVSLVLQSLENYGFVKEGLEMIVFSLLIGNYDCNPSNYGIIKNHENNTVRFAPLYDFGTSLGITYSNKIIDRYIREENGTAKIIDEIGLDDFIQNQVISKIVLEKYFQRDDKRKWYESLKLRNLPNRAYDIKIMKYKTIFEYITTFYPNEISVIMEGIEKNLTKENIDSIVDLYSEHLNPSRALMIRLFLEKRARWMTEYYNNNKYIELQRRNL